MIQLPDHCPGLGPNLKVVGVDGENSILSQTCHAFPFSMLLLCIRHKEENINQNIPKNIPENKKKKRIY